MADELSWLLKLRDEMSGAARQAAQAVANLESQMVGAEKHGNKLEEGLKDLKKELLNLEGPGKALKGFLGGVGFGAATAGAEMLVEAGEKYVELLKEGAEIVYDFTKEAVKAAAKAETIGLSFELIMGKEGGGQILKDIDELSKKTKFDDDALKNAARPLLLAGVKDPKEIANALAAAADVETITGGGMSTVNGFIDLVKKVKAKEGIGEKQIETLGVNFNDFAKNLGLTRSEAKTKIQTGELGSDRILQAIYQSIANIQGGSLGIAAEKGADTVEGKLAKLQQLPEQFLKKFAESDGFKKLSETLSRVLEGLDPDGPNGSRIVEAMNGVLDKILGWVDAIGSKDGVDKLASGIESAMNFAQTLLGVIEQVASVFKGIADTASFFGNLPGKLADLTHGNSKSDVVDSLIEGFKEGNIDYATLRAGVTGMGDEAIDAFKEKMGIHSPSRVFQELGAQTAEGFSLGLGDGDVNESLDSMIRIPSPSAGAGVLRGGGISIDVGGVHISGGGNIHEMAEQLEERLTQSILPKLANALDHLVTSEGVQDG